MRRFVWMLLLAFFCAGQFACMRMHRFSFGELAVKNSCIAVFPFVNINDAEKTSNKEDLLSEYLAMALVNEGVASTMGPRDVENIFQLAGLEPPVGVNQQEALRIGRLFAAEAVIYGSFFKMNLDSRIKSEKPEVLVGVDLYLMEVGSSSITWLYSSRLYSNGDKYLTDLAKLAGNVSQNLLANGARLDLVSKSACWDRTKIIANLNGDSAAFSRLQSKSSSQSAAVPTMPTTNAIVSKTPTITPAPTSKQPEATAPKNPLAADFFNRLGKSENLIFSTLFEQRSTILAKGQIEQVKMLAEALAAMKSTTQFMLEGHVDESGNNADDFWVSAQQVNKLRDALVEHQPALDGRIQISSKGGSNPLVPNMNQKSRAKNRRIIVSVSSR